MGVTVNSKEDVLAAKKFADYFGTTALNPSPIRPEHEPMGYDGLKLLIEAAGDIPVIVGGGVMPEHVRVLRRLGSHGFFAISPIYRHGPGKEAEQALKKYVSIWNRDMSLHRIAASLRD